MKPFFRLPRTIDWTLYLVPFILGILGIGAVYSITFSNVGSTLAISQGIYFCLGIILMVLLSFTDYRNLKGLTPLLYILGLILLFTVLFWGKSSFGATRWIDLGIFQVQPSEIFKLVLIIVLAKYFCEKINELTIKDIILGIFLALVPLLLVLKQPDFGTGMTFAAVTLGIIVASGPKRIHLFLIGFLSLLALSATWFFLKGYQRERLITFLNPARDPYGSGYNVLQSMIAVGSGGLFGKGLGQGSQSQLNFLPVAHTDFIFAGIAESIGFLGSMILIILLFFLIFRIINIARISRDSFGRLFAIGYAVLLIFQVFINIGMNIGIMPVTGIPLPFVSYGGTSLIINFAAIGILQSIYMRHKKITF